MNDDVQVYKKKLPKYSVSPLRDMHRFLNDWSDAMAPENVFYHVDEAGIRSEDPKRCLGQ